MPSPAPDQATRVVLKFGGSSVSSLAGWTTIANVVGERTEAGARVLVVHSALSGITDLLERLSGEAAAGRHADVMDTLTNRHLALCEELRISPPTTLRSDLAELGEAAEGVALTRDATARVRARILAFGERLATRIGAAFLESRGLPVEWLSAVDLLVAVDTGRQSGDAAWLSAECGSDVVPTLQARLDRLEVGLTQGFTARNAAGEAVVLGRGGSDTAAAYFAGQWGADRLEIWSDVPGMFSADPRIVPTARLLRRLDYREAQEIATTGSKVLHPRAVRAVRDRQIPLHLKSTIDPDSPNTVIERIDNVGPSQVKAVSWKGKVVLISMETLGMWQEVGFLARAFTVFRDEGLSIDLVSTSETNVTVSLDAQATLLGEAALEGATRALAKFCGVRVIRPCAAVSVVGSRIRGLLHKMGPALEAFEEKQVHLVSQAASDLNFTVVVDEEQAKDLVRTLHELLIPPSPEGSEVFGPSWEELSAAATR
jgi:diaminopimelate decarboxylase/aspartate kinase